VESENMDMDTLVSYLNKKENHEQLSFFASSNKDIFPEQWDKLWEIFIACNPLNDSAYRQLLSFCELSWEFISLRDLSIGKVSSLIERKSLLFNDEMVNEFRENHPSLLTQYYQSVVKFIIQAQDQEFDIITKVELENLVLSDIAYEDKKKILIRLDVSTIEESDILEGEVLSLLSELQVSNEIFDSLLESRINIYDKKTILLKQLEYFPIERISAILDRIQGGFEFLFKSMRVKSITYSEENFAIANALFERGFCLKPDIISSKSNNGKSKINIKPLTKV
jgi:hypothetical protein